MNSYNNKNHNNNINNNYNKTNSTYSDFDLIVINLVSIFVSVNTASDIQNQNVPWTDVKNHPHFSPRCFSCSTHTTVMIEKYNFLKRQFINLSPPLR